MSERIDSHPDEEMLEQYSLGRLSEPHLEPLEEHLLLCARCQDRIQHLDEFVAAIRSAAAQLDQTQEGRRTSRLAWRRSRTPIWAAGALAIAGLLWPLLRNRGGGFEVVDLEATRGPETAGISGATAGKRLLLSVDLTGLAEAPAYRVEIVDAAGAQRLVSEAAPEGDFLKIPVTAKLKPGRYWVRLFSSKPGSPLLREFGLRVE